MSDFERGAAAARKCRNLADQATTDEVLQAGGPDFKAGEDSDEPRDWHLGWDSEILKARGA
ncbi:MAG: hypothetical protein AAGI12_15575 [Pseudomonadota bacterium]